MHRLDLLYGYGIANTDAALLTFRKEHSNNVLRGIIAKELALMFFVVRYAVAFY